MAIFNSYVKLPEGTYDVSEGHTAVIIDHILGAESWTSVNG